MNLTKEDHAMLAGESGPGTRMAMSILVRMAEVSGADRLMDISAAHIDSALYMGEATLEFAERLASLGAKVAVPSSLNVSGLDEERWCEWPVPPEYARNALRQMEAYRSMGCTPIWTCAPYQTPFRPQFGQQVAWGESNAIAFVNSVVGARTERYPDLLDICAAITGRVPAAGLHLSENRAGKMLIQLVDIPRSIQEDELFYPILGTILGNMAGDLIPVVDGLQTRPTEEQLKALGAAAASSGGIALFHIVGVTPEAPTLQKAFAGNPPLTERSINKDTLLDTYRNLNTAQTDKVDLVALGCPHFSLDEFRDLSRLVKGKARHPDVIFLITTSRYMRDQAENEGFLQDIYRFGAKLIVDTCILTTPLLPPDIKNILTNSGKYAYYTPGLLGRQIHFSSMEDCVLSAVNGTLTHKEGVWAR